MTDASPEDRLEGFIVRFTPEIAARTRAVLRKMRARLPGALELVYDNYNALAIGFGPTEKASEAIFSIAVFPRRVSLVLIRGAGLPDPDRVLQGSGKQVRFVPLETPAVLDDPRVEALIARALKDAKRPLDPSQRHRIVIKSISKKQRPRRPRAGSSIG